MHDDVPRAHTNTGGRRGSAKLRAQQARAEAFSGLPEGCESPYKILKLVKAAGRPLGFTPRLIELLEYYIDRTRWCDWQCGAQPIVFQSVTRTALDLGCSDRQIRYLEEALFEAGAAVWEDSGNYRRYGQRDPESGALVAAFGINLAPLVDLVPVLKTRWTEDQRRHKAWIAEKRKISAYRARLRAVLAEAEGHPGLAALVREGREAYAAIAVALRPSMSLERLRALSEEHQALLGRLQLAVDEERVLVMGCGLSGKSSAMAEAICRHSTNNTTTSKPDESVTCNPPVDQPTPPTQLVPTTGAEHVTVRQAVSAASARFRRRILERAVGPLHWSDLVAAAGEICCELEIGRGVWIGAIEVMGRYDAALAVLVTDRAALRNADRQFNAGGYLRELTRRAEVGKLHLHRSIFGQLRRDLAQGGTVERQSALRTRRPEVGAGP